MEDFEARRQAFREAVERLEAAIGQVLVGQRDVVRHVLTALMGGGHVLLEGVPGLGKTLLVRTLSEALQLDYNRIQFTPDLMPADILGTTIIVQGEGGEREFSFRKGPVFTQVLLADEINRATPKTQSAMLEAMQEGSVTVGGRHHKLAQPFIVLATQNPLEMEGTYPLPEAQLDRFLFKAMVPFPTLDELSEVIDRTTGTQTQAVEPVMSGEELLSLRQVVRAVPVSEAVKRYGLRLVLATHPDSEEAPELTTRYVQYGASPRGAQALILAGKVNALMAGRGQVDYADIRAAALPALRHRVVLNFEAGADGIGTDAFIGKLLEAVPDVDPRLRAEAFA
ncbi:MAG: AAA family ATPase [Myxococcales bacterium]|nr:AAA family ATPase [Myxococcales bacterium]